MVTIDASVWVAGDLGDEPASRSVGIFLERVLATKIPVHQPTLTLVEVATAVARRTGDMQLARQAGAHLLRFPGLAVYPLDLDLASLSAAVGSEARLRGADSIYAATALARRAILVTLDEELRQRAPAAVPTLTPDEWLSRES